MRNLMVAYRGWGRVSSRRRSANEKRHKPLGLRRWSSRDRTRTCDPLINSQLLYQLSYSGRRGKIGRERLKFKASCPPLRLANGLIERGS
jgi:hypothetical protein